MGEESYLVEYIGAIINNRFHKNNTNRPFSYVLGEGFSAFALVLKGNNITTDTLLKYTTRNNKEAHIRVLNNYEENHNYKDAYGLGDLCYCCLITIKVEDYITDRELSTSILVRDYPLLRGYAKGVLLYDNLIKQRVEQA